MGHQAEIGFTINGICNPAFSSPFTLDRITILHYQINHSTRVRKTYDAFFSMTGLLANSSNSKFRIRTNKIALISAKANR